MYSKLENSLKLIRKELGNNLSGNVITIIGLGAIGFQLSLSLIREGVQVNCFTKNYTKGIIKANSINTIRSDYTLASFNLFKSLRTAILSSSVLIEPAKSIINSKFNLISGGWKGLPGDIVVDDANDPRFVIGTISSSFSINPLYVAFDEWVKTNS